MEQNLAAGTTICVLDNLPYPFFGSYRQFRVVQPSKCQSSQELQQLQDRYTPSIFVVRRPLGDQLKRYELARPLLENCDDYRLLSRDRQYDIFVRR